MPGEPMLMCWYGRDEVARTHNQEPIRELSPEDLVAKAQATGFLVRFFRDSPFAMLQASYEELVAAVAALEASFPGSARLPEPELNAVHRAFSNWLSAVRRLVASRGWCNSDTGRGSCWGC
jgi:hypothetical protein